MIVSDYIVHFLESKGVQCVFELTGGMITYLLDSIYRQNSIKRVTMHHEQGAAFAAEAVGRITGIPGVALATSGPGATNLLTGICSCYFDSSPAVFITGQVNRNELKGERQIRQLGFQETDIVSMARPITKAAWQVQKPEDVPDLLHRAFVIATTERPGPVLLDIPMDVQKSDINASVENHNMTLVASDQVFNQSMLQDLFTQMSNAKRPLILVGGGIRSARACELLRDFIKKIRIPVINTLMGVDILPYTDPMRIGMIGTYGNRWANLAIAKSDFVLVLGSRLDVRQTGADTKSFKGNRVIFHVDCENGEINNRVKGCNAIVSDLHKFLTEAIHMVKDRDFVETIEWLSEIEALKREWPDTKELSGISGINPNLFMHQLSKASTEAFAYSVDVGQHQMWAAQSIEIGHDQRFLTSGGMGSMGFSLPSAIGAVMTTSRPVVSISGDGGFQCNIQELQTIVKNNMPIKIIIINNCCLGMVRQFQESYLDSRYVSTVWGYDGPDFEKVAAAYGISGSTVKDKSDVERALNFLWKERDKPALLQVMIDPSANAYPKITFNEPINVMEPHHVKEM